MNSQLKGIQELAMTNFTIPKMPDFGKDFANQISENQRRQTAVWSCEKLAEQIHEFEAALDLQHEVGAYLASFGSTILLHLRSVKSIQPNLIVFDGKTDNNENARLVQNMSQLNILLVATKKLSNEAFRIGYVNLEELAAQDKSK